MTGKLEAVNGQNPQDVMAILKDRAAEFEITVTPDENTQIVRCRIKEAGEDFIGYVYTQYFPAGCSKRSS